MHAESVVKPRSCRHSKHLLLEFDTRDCAGPTAVGLSLYEYDTQAYERSFFIDSPVVVPHTITNIDP